MAESPIARVRLLAPVLLATALMLPLAAKGAGNRRDAVAVQQASTPAPQTGLGRRQAASVERHIATLHSELRIAPAQERLWQALAAAMRDNVLQLDGLYVEREQRQASMSAVDDLKSYALLQQIRARNLETLIGPLQSLYDSFSPSQKRRADAIFHDLIRNAAQSMR